MAFNIVAGVNNAVYGSVSGSGSYEENSEVTLEVTVNDGYRFVQWDDGNTDNPRVFNAVADVTLVATLEAIPEYAVTLSENNSNLGSTSGSGNYLEGSTATISATPALHCRFVKWDDDNTDNPRTLTVNAAITLEALFETVNWYTITATSSDDTMGSVTGAGDYDEGDTVTLTAVPETGYKFTGWSDENTDNPRTFTASQSLNLSATFAAIVYTDVTIASNDSELGTVSGATSGNIETGSSITLTATPATDCKFDGWQVDGEMLEDTSTTITLAVTGNEMDVIAVFSAIIFYQVNLLSSDTDCGHITVVSQTAEPRGVNNNIWPEGTELELQAVCESGGNFLNWGDGDKNLVKYVTVSENETIRANFYPSSGLILVTKKILNQTWTTIKNFFAAPTGASKIGAPANNALGATTLADVVNSAGQPGGIALLNNSGKVAAADIDGTLSNDTSGNAATASVADKVGTSTVGSSTEPVYINAGTPTACGTSLAVDITGNAATATTAAACSGNAATATTADSVSRATFGNSGTGEHNCNNIKSNGLWYYSSNGPATTLGASTTDGALYSQAYSTSWCGQIAQDYRNGRLFVRGLNNGTWKDWMAILDSGNYTSYTVKKDGTGASGSWGISVTGSSASCTGNAATATSATSATTATNANNLKVTHTGAAWRDILSCATGFTSASNQAVYGHNSGSMAYYIDANATSGNQRAILRLGNATANTTAAGHNGQIWMYGTSTGYTCITPGYNSTSSITLTLPSSTGTLALTSSNITGSSASCTGNAATATTASACSGNAASATYATNIRVTDTDSNTWYPLVFSSGSAANTNYAARVDSDSILVDPGTSPAANTQGNCYLQLGNAKAKATAGNKMGRIRLYGSNTSYTEITSAVGATARSISFPDKAGTVALTSDIPSESSKNPCSYASSSSDYDYVYYDRIASDGKTWRFLFVNIPVSKYVNAGYTFTIPSPYALDWNIAKVICVCAGNSTSHYPHNTEGSPRAGFTSSSSIFVSPGAASYSSGVNFVAVYRIV